MGQIEQWIQLDESEEEATVLVGVESPKKAGTQQGEQLQE